ncbi:hypothetical protein N9L68_04015 [bacterium]|nr:hypothetical protein [bacterium]
MADMQADQAIAEMRYALKGARGEYYRNKYPKRRRPSDQPYTHEGFTYYNDAIAEVRYGAKVANNPPKRNHRWRMMLGQTVDDEKYHTLEEVVDWSGLETTTKRPNIPELVQKLVTVDGPTKRAIEEWRDDFDYTRNVLNPNKPEDANVSEPEPNGRQEDVRSGSNPEVQVDHVDSFEGDQIYIMEDEADTEFMLVPGEYPVTGAVAATMMAVCATCKMLLDQCECRPRFRKQKTKNTCEPCQKAPDHKRIPRAPPAKDIPVGRKCFSKEVYDDDGELHGWILYEGDEQKFIAAPTETFEEEAAWSYPAQRSDPRVVAAEKELRMTESIDVTRSACAAAPSGTRATSSAGGCQPTKSNNKLYQEEGQKANVKGKAKMMQRAPILDPDVCEHRTELLSTRGSNQYYDKAKCEACLTLISDEMTEWWTLEKERRRLQKEATNKEYANQATRTTRTITAS